MPMSPTWDLKWALQRERLCQNAARDKPSCGRAKTPRGHPEFEICRRHSTGWIDVGAPKGHKHIEPAVRLL
jgi:hypothetical protein